MPAIEQKGVAGQPAYRLSWGNRYSMRFHAISSSCGGPDGLGRGFGWWAVMLLTCALLNIPAQAGEFRAAVVKIDITPDTPQMLIGYAARTSTGVLDRIHHRILALDDGTTQFFLVSSEFCVISPAEYDKVAEVLAREHGIKPENFWWTLTHTHSAPEVGPAGLPAVFMAERYHHKPDSAYTAFAEEKLIEGILEARRQLAPAKLGVGWGYSRANINRRARNAAGRTTLGMNPDGPTDRRIGVLRIDHTDGRPLALVANYAIHGTVLGQDNLQISGDAPGVVSDYVERKTGALTLFVNGAAGNLAPIYSFPSTRPGTRPSHLDEFEVLLGDKIVAAAAAITATTPQVTLKVGATVFETPLKPGLKWSEELRHYARTTDAGAAMVRVPVGFLRINRDVAIWNAPLELFCEISNGIRADSPFPYTFYYGYTNGWLGYLPTAAEFKFGGYEARTSPFTPAAEDDLQQHVMSYLEGEMQR